jgi:hypothetical protein
VSSSQLDLAHFLYFGVLAEEVLAVSRWVKHESLACAQLCADVVAVGETHVLDDIFPRSPNLICGIFDVVVEDVQTKCGVGSLFFLLGCRSATPGCRSVTTASAASAPRRYLTRGSTIPRGPQLSNPATLSSCTQYFQHIIERVRVALSEAEIGSRQ